MCFVFQMGNIGNYTGFDVDTLQVNGSIRIQYVLSLSIYLICFTVIKIQVVYKKSELSTSCRTQFLKMYILVLYQKTS